MDLVPGPEMLFECPAVVHNPLDLEQRLAAGDTGSKSAHALRDLDGTGRGGDLVFVCKDDVPPFALPR